MNSKKMNNKGFSLVELIVVIAIMAILVGALAPQFIKYVEQSRQSTDMQNVNEMKSAIEIYAADKDSASSMSILVTGGASGTASMDGAAASNANIASSVNLKSQAWGTQTYTYGTNYQWTTGACQNTKAPSRDMAEIFK